MPLHHEDSGSLALSVAVCLSKFLAQQLASGKAPCILQIKTDKLCRLKKHKYIEFSHQPLALLKHSPPTCWRCSQTANEISETSVCKTIQEASLSVTQQVKTDQKNSKVFQPSAVRARPHSFRPGIFQDLHDVVLAFPLGIIQGRVACKGIPTCPKKHLS